ncbi:MAG: hypothetical protein ACKO04_10015 [Actinomycetes bacterium]
MSDQTPTTSGSTEVDPLPELEADLAAVEAALASLDRIDAEGRTGGAVVAEINAVVDPARFGQPSPGTTGPDGTDSDLVGDGLDGEQVDPLADPPGPA